MADRVDPGMAPPKPARLHRAVNRRRAEADRAQLRSVDDAPVRVGVRGQRLVALAASATGAVIRMLLWFFPPGGTICISVGHAPSLNARV